MKKLYLALSILLLSAGARAQIVITPGSTPGYTATTIMNKLLGPGVIGMNAVLTCLPTAHGTFSVTASSPLIFDSGIVLTSGVATQAAGPGSFFASVDNGAPGHPMLTTLAGSTSYNACLLDFDFRPAGDTVRFNYIFGSEEYPGYTCSPFNDPFGFFISGPGYPAATNIALVPGTNIPVCINSINCGATGGYPLSTCTAMGPGAPFCAYFINNAAGTLITYSGITRKLMAIATVTPCDTFHLKLGVSDANDGIYDSGVFLEAGSLTSTSISVAPQGINPNDTTSSQYCVRGCMPGKFVFKRRGNLANPFTIKYLIGGTAVNGFDYTWIPDSVIIPATDSVQILWINGLPVPPTGPKVVKLYILAPYTCGGMPAILDSAELTILDSFRLNILTSDTAICRGQYVTLMADGDTMLDFTWTPGTALSSTSTLSPVIASPTVTTTYTLTGVFPGCAPSRDRITITVYERPTPDAGPDLKITCHGTPLQLGVTATPVGIPYTYLWSPGTDLSNPNIANPVFTPSDSVDRWQYVTVSAPVYDCSSTDTIFLHVLPNDFQLHTLDTIICYPAGSYQVRGIGDTEFSYSWSPTTGVSDPLIYLPTIAPPYPPAETIYTVTASYPNCPDIKHTIKYSIWDPRVDILISDTTVCIGLPMPLNVRYTPEELPYTFTWSPTTYLIDATTSLAPQFFTMVPGVYKYTVTVETPMPTCKWEDSITIMVAPPVKITIDPADAIIKYGEEIQLTATQATSDPLFYTWVPNDGSLTNPNINNPVAKPLDSTLYTVYGMNQWGCIDSAKTIIYVETDMTEYIPTAFTPNGDGLNDLFRIRGIKYQRIVDFKVYDRWGAVVYDHKTGDAQGWDGTINGRPADIGVYHYSIIMAKLGNVDKVYKGEVTLIR
ncbi:choice-of-anchor L domain-containing protein [Nemorincola caseinilytica]